MPKAFPSTGVKEKDDDILAVAARTDPGAFTCLYRRYVTRVYRYLYCRTGNTTDAEDLTAQAFAAAWEGLDRYRAQGIFAAWLFSIARNKVNDHFRRQRSHFSLEQVVRELFIDSDLGESLAHRQDLDRLAALIAKLDAQQLELLHLRFAADLTYGEMGDLMGRSEAAVKMAVGRLLGRLREDWAKRYE